jgi:hypothetical protein
MNKINIINHLINKFGYQKYLEIGVMFKKNNFDQIKCDYKISVDPGNYDTYDYNMTSNDFFEQNKEKFDIIFIDGLHLAEQVDKDIENSLNILNNNGIIVLHDTNPPTEFHACETYPSESPAYPYWNGTVWKSIFKLRKTRKDIEVYTYDCDWGVTVLKKCLNTELIDINNEYYTFSIFDKNRNKILNLISCNELS